MKRPLRRGRHLCLGKCSPCRGCARPALGKAREATAPLFIVHGEQDKIVSMDGTRLLLANWKGPTSAEIVPGAFHETFNDPGREKVYARVVAWLDATV